MSDQPSKTPGPRRVGWPARLTLIVFLFVAFECVLLAVAMKGAWFILLAPGAVCGARAWGMWREIRRRLRGE